MQIILYKVSIVNILIDAQYSKVFKLYSKKPVGGAASSPHTEWTIYLMICADCAYLTPTAIYK